MLCWGGENTEKNLVMKSQKEDIGLDRGRALNFFLEEYIMNVDFTFNYPWCGPVTNFPEYCNEIIIV